MLDAQINYIMLLFVCAGIGLIIGRIYIGSKDKSFKCPNCGVENPISAKYCQECGADLNKKNVEINVINPF